MTAILYARVSTPDQAEHDLSIPAQIHAMEAKAKSLGKAVVEVFKDVGSGRTMKDRPGLLAAVKYACEHKEVDTVFVHRIDRLARNAADYHFLKMKLSSAGVRIVPVVEHVDDTPAGEFLENIFAAYAEFYSANLGVDIRNGMTERLRQGRWSWKAPLGYALDRGRLVPDPARARFVRTAFRRYATEPISVTQLAKELHEQGLTTAHGKPIRANRLYVVLRNKIYTGTLETALGVFPGKHEPLVEPSVFQRVQERLGQGRGKAAPLPRPHFPLAGLLNCTVCGRVLTGERHVKPNGKEYRYYRCHAGHRALKAAAAEANIDTISETNLHKTAET